MISELNNLVNELNFKKNVLDTEFSPIVNGIKDWCCKEYARINGEFDELKKFIFNNLNTFYKNTTHRGPYDNSYNWLWRGLKINVRYVNNQYVKVTSVGLTSDWEYDKNLGFMWTHLPKPRTYDHYKFFENTDMNNSDVTYWTDYKGWLAVYNELLTETTKQVKDYLGTLILEQDARFNEMNKACKEIDEDNTKTIEIKVKVRV